MVAVALTRGRGVERAILYAALGVITGSLFALPLQLDLAPSPSLLVIGYAVTLAGLGCLMGRREGRLLDANTVDPQTHTANFRALLLRLSQEIDRSLRHRLPLSLLLVEVRRGGAVSTDAIQRDAARILARLCRSADFVATCDGGRFAIVAPCSSAHQARLFADRILDELEDDIPDEPITAFIGIADVGTPGTTDAMRLFESAEQALIMARIDGRGVWMAGTTAGPALAITADAPVSTIMKKRVVCVRPDMHVTQLTALFREQEIGGAPVVDAFGRILGIVSKGDVLRGFLDRAAHHQLAEDLMTSIVFRLAEDAPISQAAALMAYEGVARIVIVGKDLAVVGILSAEDVLRNVAPLPPPRTWQTVREESDRS